MQKSFGGELYGVATLDTESLDYPVDHAILKLGDQYYDFEGPFDVTAIGEKEVLLSRDDDRAFWFDDEFLDDSQMERLQAVLNRAHCNAVRELPSNPNQEHIGAAAMTRKRKTSVSTRDALAR